MRAAGARAFVGCTLSLGAACQAAEPGVWVVPELPTEPGYVGLVYRGAGQPWAATGLSRSSGGRVELDVVEPGDTYDRVSVVYFSEPELRAHTGLDDDALRSAPLLEPSPARALVRPRWSATGARDDATVLLAADAPPLAVAAAWSGACPRVLGESPARVDVRCYTRSCPTTVRQEGCELIFRSESCPFNARTTIDGLGRVEVDLGTALGRCQADTLAAREGPLRFLCEGGAQRIETRSCELVVHPEDDQVPALQIESRLLLPPLELPVSERFRPVRELVLEGDRLFTTRRIEDLEHPPEACLDQAVELLELGLEDLQPVLSATLAPCLLSLIGSDQRGELFALHDSPSPLVRRLRADGVVLREAALLAEREGAPISPLRLVFDASTQTVAEFGLTVDDAGRTFVVTQFLDAQTLGAKFEPWVLSARTVEAWLHGPGELGLMENRERLYLFDLSAGTSRLWLDLSGVCNLELTRKVTRLPSNQLVLVDGSFEGGLTLISPDPLRCSLATPFERVGSPSQFVTLASDPRRLLVALVDRSAGEGLSRDSFLAHYDLEEERFLVPSQTLGGGLVGFMEAHALGAVYTVSPAEGRVARIVRADAATGR